MTSVYFSLIDSCSNPMVGSRVKLEAHSSPYVTGSLLACGGPASYYTDSNGSLTISNVIAGLYKVSISPANANNPSANNVLQNFANMVLYINVPETGGGTVNANSILVTLTL